MPGPISKLQVNDAIMSSLVSSGLTASARYDWMTRAKQTQPQGSWHWHAVARRLVIEAPAGSDLSELSGNWSIDAIEQMFEGLSRGRLDKAFGESDGCAARCGCRAGGTFTWWGPLSAIQKRMACCWWETTFRKSTRMT